MGMFHMVGVTPDAPTLRAAFGGDKPAEKIAITRRDIERVYASYSAKNNPLNLVVFSGPQQSLFEMKNLAALLDGQKIRSRQSPLRDDQQRREKRGTSARIS